MQPPTPENTPPRRAPNYINPATGRLNQTPAKKDFEIDQADAPTLSMLGEEALRNHQYSLAENYFIKAFNKDPQFGLQGLFDLARLTSVEDPNYSMYLMNMADGLKRQTTP